MHALTAFVALLTPAGMIAIPAGVFEQGGARSAHPDETPSHRAELHGFHMNATLVAQGAGADVPRSVPRHAART